jgi:hypothetical protein
VLLILHRVGRYLDNGYYLYKIVLGVDLCLMFVCF